jgi:hypothetical protein
VACNKNQNQIDVSKQDQTDMAGNAIAWLNDGQWTEKSFTLQEENLFSALDTANLEGTSRPDSNYAYFGEFFPNPFGAAAMFGISFSMGFTGQLELKYVVVDSHLNPKAMGALRIQAPPDPNHPTAPVSSIHQLNLNIAPGKYRIYYTLSTQSEPNFFNSWGNIERSP